MSRGIHAKINSMSISIDITSNIAEATAAMGDIPESVMVEATRVSINRALVSGRKEAAKTLRERLNIKSKDVKSKMAINKASGKNLMSMQGILSFDDVPLPILQFVKGKKDLIKQKGIKIQKRRKLKVEIVRGKKFYMKGAFIQKVRSKQVFKRGSNGRFYKQSAPSIAEFINRQGLKRPVSQAIIDSFNKNYANQVSFRMQKQMERVRKARLKKV